MILKAAISNYKDTRGIRNGRGYWRQLTAVSYHDVDSSVRDVTYVKKFGACKLVTSSEYRAPNSMALPMFGPTGAINLEGDHIDEKDEKLASLDRLDHEPQDDMPVWVYGNIWADHEMKHSGDTSHLRMMGVGARFAKSRSHFDAFGVPTDQIKLCGSSVGLCTDDGESPHMFTTMMALPDEVQILALRVSSPAVRENCALTQIPPSTGYRTGSSNAAEATCGAVLRA